MSVLVVGLSHRSAPLRLLEAAALDALRAEALADRALTSPHVAEAVVLATCNRLEVYADVSKFHGGVADIGEAVAGATGLPLEALTEHLYVHYDAAAVAHLFGVSCGLDSMAVGEQQILGQVRTALRAGQDSGAAGRVLGPLLQHALRVGKRAHSETAIDRAAPSLVEAGLDAARDRLGDLSGARALVIGAGTMSGLAVAAVARAGVGSLTVANRTFSRAQRLAGNVGGTAVAMAELPAALARADLVVSGTGTPGHVVGLSLAAAASSARAGAPQVYLDLALPRDVDPDVASLPGVSVLDLERVGAELSRAGTATDVASVRALVTEEVAAYLAAQRAEAVAPTVVALRAQARSVVDAELERLLARLPDTDERVRAEITQGMHRVVEKLLHTPTVRMKELARGSDGDAYAQALRELFGLDPVRVASGSDAPLGRERDVVGVVSDLPAELRDDAVPVLKGDGVPVLKGDGVPVLKGDGVPVPNGDAVPHLRGDAVRVPRPLAAGEAR